MEQAWVEDGLHNETDLKEAHFFDEWDVVEELNHGILIVATYFRGP